MLVAVLEQLGVFIKLHRRARHPVRLAVQGAAQLADELLLRLVLPDVIPGEHLHHELARFPNKARAQRRRQVLRTQPAAGVLRLDGFKSLANVRKERLLVILEPFRHPRLHAQHLDAQITDGSRQRAQFGGQRGPFPGRVLRRQIQVGHGAIQSAA